ncbi:MAG: hypothetical protein RL654_2339 [Pseudomonadota bacterium]|jgi:small-conductance mechanosensitive channel
MTPDLSTLDFPTLLAALMRPSSLVELAVLAATMATSWLLVRLMRGMRGDRGQRDAQGNALPSIWFGTHLVDGVLFPLLMLALAYVARRVLLDLGQPLAVFRLAIPVLLSLAVIRLSVRVLSAAFPASALMRAVERTISWVAWLGMVLWVTGVLPVLLDELDEIRWKIGANTLSLRNIIEGGLSAGFVMVVVLWISAALEARLLAGASGAQLSLRKVAANALRAILLFVGLLMALSAVGIDLTALSVLGGALGVGIGLGLQKLAANYVSGFVILAERSLRIGDIVNVGGFEGAITDITTRYTVIRAPSGRESIVPNETLTTTAVQNLSLADRRVLLSTVLVVGHDTDVLRLREQLVEAVVAVPRVLADPGPAAQLSRLGNDGLEISVHFWIDDPENGQGNVRSEVNLAILGLLRREGIGLSSGPQVLRLEAPAVPLPVKAPAAESAR